MPQDLQIKSHLASAFACQITSIAAKISANAQIRMVMSIPFTALLAILLIRWPSNCFQYTTVLRLSIHFDKYLNDAKEKQVKLAVSMFYTELTPCR
ncbi:MAG: hypothetical protein ACLT4C_03405 [Butyricicoccus sp.]